MERSDIAAGLRVAALRGVLDSRAATLREAHVDLARLYADDVVPTIPGIEIVTEIGRGGMGIVYRARQTQLERDVAVKVIARDLLDDPSTRARFHREARILAKLDHPAIVRIHEWGETADHAYFVMELVDGGPLGDRLAPNDAVARVLEVCDALAHAHRHGIVHRDIKPSNVLVSSAGRVKLVDFGIAILAAQPAITAGGWVGTPRYMAPEAFAGSTVDPRLDVYSVAMLLRTVIAPVAMPPQVDAIIRRGVALDPAARPRSIEAFAACLRRVRAGTSPRTRRRWLAAPLCLPALALVPNVVTAPEAPAATRIADAPRTPRATPRTVDTAIRAQPRPAARDHTPPAAPQPVQRGAATRPPAPRLQVTRQDPATLTLRVRPWADVTVDGAAPVRVEPPRTVLELPPGAHTIIATNPVTLRSETRSVRLAAREAATLVLDLRGER